MYTSPPEGKSGAGWRLQGFVDSVGVLPAHHASLAVRIGSPGRILCTLCVCISVPFHVYLNFVLVGWLPETGCLR